MDLELLDTPRLFPHNSHQDVGIPLGQRYTCLHHNPDGYLGGGVHACMVGDVEAEEAARDFEAAREI